MVEAAGIEPEGGQSQHNAEPAQNRAKPEQNQALTAPVRPAENEPESTSVHFLNTSETLPSTQKLYGTTKAGQQPTPNDLARVVADWHTLSDDQKDQIMTIIEGASENTPDSDPD
jgi:hypothetical protein